MKLRICRCCGEEMKPRVLRWGDNPNLCGTCLTLSTVSDGSEAGDADEHQQDHSNGDGGDETRCQRFQTRLAEGGEAGFEAHPGHADNDAEPGDLFGNRRQTNRVRPGIEKRRAVQSQIRQEAQSIQ